MTKTEAAEILANHANVLARRYGWTGPMTDIRIGVVISEAQHQTTPGSLLHQAATLRPAHRTIRRAGRATQED